MTERVNRSERFNRSVKFARNLSFAVAIIELALAQFHIRMTRLSAAELTGISLFAFMIFGLVTLFAVTRMEGETPGTFSIGGRIFALVMNVVTALAAAWYLSLLFADSLFFRNLWYTQDPRVPELLPLGPRIAASLPLGIIIAGTGAYYVSALLIAVSFFGAEKK